eukprot:symbB.v1.2.013810.t1/scaffold984.1/size146690/1
MAVWEVCAAWGAVLSDAWLPRTLRHFMEEGIEEEAIERHCQQLLQMILAGAPLGISPSQPWPDFASDLRPPDHPGERVISNLKRFAGNYVTLLFTGAILVGCSEMFDVHVMQSKSAGGGFRSVGGAWLRYLLAVIAQIGFVCIALCGQRGAILASIVIFLHSLFRARPWTVMAKDRLKVH